MSWIEAVNEMDKVLKILLCVCVTGQRHQLVFRGSCKRSSQGTPMISSQVPESWKHTVKMMIPRLEQQTGCHRTQVSKEPLTQTLLRTTEEKHPHISHLYKTNNKQYYTNSRQPAER